VTFTRSTAALGDWAKGALTWSDGTHAVRSPIALRPVALKAPGEVHAAASASGSQAFQVTPGSSTALTTTVSGLTAATSQADSISTGAFDINKPVADGSSTKSYPVKVEAGTRAVRISLDSSDDTADLDLFLYDDKGQLVDLSATGSADEQVTDLDLAAGTYTAYVNGFSTPGGSTAYTLYTTQVPAASAGNLSVSPNPANAQQGQPLTLTGTWSGLDPSKRYLGVLSYSGTSAVTLFSVG
jgi:hypothetical protein